MKAYWLRALALTVLPVGLASTGALAGGSYPAAAPPVARPAVAPAAGFRPMMPPGGGFVRHGALAANARIVGLGPVGLPGAWATPAPTTTVIVIERPESVARLPTAADLPVANVVRQPVAPPLLYVVNDLSQGRSGRVGGAKIISAGPSRPMEAGAGFDGGSQSAPRIIELTAQ